MTVWSSPPPGPIGDRSHGSDGRLIVGLGNVLLGDDGFGAAVCEELRRRPPETALPAETRLLDGGTLGSSLVTWLVEASAVVIVDAVDVPGPPGSLLVWRGPSLATIKADGGGALADLIALALLSGLPSDGLSLVGVIPEGIRPGVGLSATVRAAVPRAASLVVHEIRMLTGGME